MFQSKCIDNTNSSYNLLCSLKNFFNAVVIVMKYSSKELLGSSYGYIHEYFYCHPLSNSFVSVLPPRGFRCLLLNRVNGEFLIFSLNPKLLMMQSVGVAIIFNMSESSFEQYFSNWVEVQVHVILISHIGYVGNIFRSILFSTKYMEVNPLLFSFYTFFFKN